MAAKAVFSGRFDPAADSLAATAASYRVSFSAVGTEMTDAWALLWQACDGAFIRSCNGALSFGYPFTFEPVSAVVGRTHLVLDTEEEVSGARKALMAMIDLCDRETREAVFALAGER